MGENEEDFEDFESSIFFEAQEYFVFESRLDFFFLKKWSHSQSCFNVAKRCENRR